MALAQKTGAPDGGASRPASSADRSQRMSPTVITATLSAGTNRRWPGCNDSRKRAAD